MSPALSSATCKIIVACLILHVALDNAGLMSRLFRTSFLGYVGKISYSLYLWQDLFIPVDGPSWGAARKLPWAFVIPVAISVLSYHLMEKPILRIKDRVAGEASRPDPVLRPGASSVDKSALVAGTSETP